VTEKPYEYQPGPFRDRVQGDRQQRVEARAVVARRADETPAEDEALIGYELEKFGLEPARGLARQAVPDAEASADMLFNLDAGDVEAARSEPFPQYAGSSQAR
jgi:hypothetical protein